MSIVRSAVRRTERAGGTLIGIMYTHRHADHLGDPKLFRTVSQCSVSEGTVEVTHIDRILSDGVILELRGPTTRHEWKVLETLGHCPGHLCLMSPAGLIAGDMVAGVGTILILPESGDMLVYLTQLERLLRSGTSSDLPVPRGLLSPPLNDFSDRYLRHRRARHDRVRVAVDQASDPVRIAALAYADPPDAHPGLALDQTYAHLLALEKEGIVRSDGARWFTA